ncbi:GIY-YIG nuclease family protein [Cryomorpha ignava]|uniref:GIY-YIG nuclease family protein n=1 Tax=Cryomorpha ignava TaxID=101383 RepID=A0A7K3WSW3_9FLAO|nr:GIY-YIG nuclease family protein [Cryomorpha ignava]NEN24546.1 GIY-YIG nuclease family protein [Cryomorpha ignava]
MPKTGYTYVLSNKNRTVLYVGVTSRIRLRMLQHKSGHGCVFSSRYNVYDLMYFETIPIIVNAIKREKQLKNWHKEWKWNFIKENNPDLIDLACECLPMRKYWSIRRRRWIRRKGRSD